MCAAEGTFRHWSDRDIESPFVLNIATQLIAVHGGRASPWPLPVTPLRMAEPFHSLRKRTGAMTNLRLRYRFPENITESTE